MKFTIPALLVSALLEPSLSRNLRQNLNTLEESCTALVGLTEYPYGTNSDADETFLVCETPSGNTYNVKHVSTAWINSKIANGQLKSGKTELDIPAGTGINPRNQELQNSSPPGLINNPKKERKLAETTGTPTVLVVRVIALDGQTSISENTLSDSVFGTATDPVNLKSQYKACSHGKLDFQAASAITGITNGATTVTVTASVSEGDVVMRNAITEALNTKFGVSSPTAIADYVMYCLPPNTMSGIAYAFVNSWMSVYSNEWCTYVSAQMHEIGHNLNLAHSGEGGQTYADQSGMMGYSYADNDAPAMCFNAAKCWQLGWYDARKLTIDASSNTSYIGVLASIVQDPNDASGPPMLIKLNTSTGQDYYINFNAKTDFNSGTVEGGNQVMIVRAGGEGVNYATSELLAKLSAGGSYTITNFDGSSQDLTISVTSVGLTTADVSVCLGSCPTGCTSDAECDDGIYCNGAEICNAGLCQAGPPIVCDNNNVCDGLETCDEGLQQCVAGTPLVCDDGLFCNGMEYCDSSLGCLSGTPIICDNGLFCDGVETCNEATKSCDEGTPPVCDDFNPCNGVETCSALSDQCEPGTPITCDSIETCTLCPNECTSDFGGTACGNGVCEDTEDCFSCPADCNSKLDGKKANRFCCAGGPAGTCADSKCTTSGFDCSADSSGPTDTSCCGDAVCEGSETFSTCPNDCEAPPLTSAPTKSPTGPGCPICAATNQPCCGTCVSNGNPSRRGCFL